MKASIVLQHYTKPIAFLKRLYGHFSVSMEMEMKGHSWTLGIVEVRTLHSPGECSPDSGVSHGSVELIRDPFYKTVMSLWYKILWKLFVLNSWFYGEISAPICTCRNSSACAKLWPYFSCKPKISIFQNWIMKSNSLWSRFPESLQQKIVGDYPIQYTDSWTKWPTFNRQHFQMHCWMWKSLYSSSNFTEVCSLMSNWHIWSKFHWHSFTGLSVINGNLISTMGFPILVRCHLYIETMPRGHDFMELLSSHTKLLCGVDENLTSGLYMRSPITPTRTSRPVISTYII